MIRISLLIVVLFFINSVFAQVRTDTVLMDDHDTTLIHHQLIPEIIIQSPVVIYSQDNWAGGYTKLNSYQLNSGNAYGLQQQLNKVPGVMMQQGTMSTNRITIRGIGSRTPYQSNRIKAYWGEMPLTDGEGATSLEDIELNDIASLEVIKGSSSALFGAGMGGAILLHPFGYDNITPHVSVKSEIGAFQTFSQHGMVNWQSTSKNRYSLVGGAINSQGYRDNSKYQRYNLTAKGMLHPGKQRVNFLYNVRYLKGEIPSSLDSIDFYDHPSKAADSWSNIGGYEEDIRHMFSLGLISPLGHHSTNTFTFFGKLSALTELRPFNKLKEDRYAGGLRNRYVLNFDRVKTTLGVESMFERSRVSLYSVSDDDRGQLLSTQEHLRYYYNVFALTEWYPLSHLTVYAAFNFNKTGYHAIAEDFKHHYKAVYSPRLGLNYALLPTIHMFVSAGHGFSAPSIEEAQMPDGSFNASIKPEEGMNYEWGLRYHSPAHRVEADITLYLMKMNNLLVTERDEQDQFYGKNAGKTTHKGLELSVLYRLIKALDNHALNIHWSYFISENKFDDFMEDGMDYRGNHLPGIPQSNLGVELDAAIKDFTVSVEHKYFDEQYLNDANTKHYSAYHKTNFKVSYTIKHKKTNWKVYAGADNLFNTHYASMVLINAQSFGTSLPRYYYPGLPFNMYGGVKVKF
jgi:iron complex outermembrane receptor protein